MIKFYCDRCGQFIPDGPPRFKVHIYSETDAATRSVDENLRKRHYCENCACVIKSATEKDVNDWCK